MFGFSSVDSEEKEKKKKKMPQGFFPGDTVE